METKNHDQNNQSSSESSLTVIYNKDNSELSKEDLNFVYGMDTIPEKKGGGFKPYFINNSKLKEILEKRNTKSDLSLITGYSEDEIGTSKEEIFKEGIKFYYGDIDFEGNSEVKGNLPEIVRGEVILDDITSLDGLTLPKKIINGGLGLGNIKTIGNTELPEVDFYTILDNIDLDELELVTKKYPQLKIHDRRINNAYAYLVYGGSKPTIDDLRKWEKEDKDKEGERNKEFIHEMAFTKAAK